jgi:hypothetical protein
MKVLKLSEYIKESISLIDHDGILLIIDVQSNFKQYFPKGPNSFLKKLDSYCEYFPEEGDIKGVYQIWDSNRGSKPTYKFKNQRDLIEKKFGIKKYYKNLKGGFKEWIYNILDNDTLNKFKSKKNKFNDGDIFKIKDKDEYLVYVGNNHKWFYLTENLVNFFKKLKNKKIIICGGAESECLDDVYIALKSFNVNPIKNHQYIYSAETGDKK